MLCLRPIQIWQEYDLACTSFSHAPTVTNNQINVGAKQDKLVQTKNIWDIKLPTVHRALKIKLLIEVCPSLSYAPSKFREKIS